MNAFCVALDTCGLAGYLARYGMLRTRFAAASNGTGSHESCSVTDTKTDTETRRAVREIRILIRLKSLC
jgi:hypothetical protein